MKIHKGTIALILLIVGMIALAIGISTNKDVYSYIAIALVLISLVLGRRKRPGIQRKR